MDEDEGEDEDMGKKTTQAINYLYNLEKEKLALVMTVLRCHLASPGSFVGPTNTHNQPFQP